MLRYWSRKSGLNKFYKVCEGPDSVVLSNPHPHLSAKFKRHRCYYLLTIIYFFTPPSPSFYSYFRLPKISILTSAYLTHANFLVVRICKTRRTHKEIKSLFYVTKKYYTQGGLRNFETTV